jgi:hypothetical protein
MPASSEKQRKAMGAELARRRKGKSPQRFKSMSRKELREFASSVKRK